MIYLFKAYSNNLRTGKLANTGALLYIHYETGYEPLLTMQLCAIALCEVVIDMDGMLFDSIYISDRPQILVPCNGSQSVAIISASSRRRSSPEP
jgi:hypothetical protein